MSCQGGICDFFLGEQPSDSIQTHPAEEVLSANLNLSYETNRHRTSVSSSSGSSLWEPASPSVSISRRPSTSLCPDPDEEAEDAPWNLVAYHIPWGPGYEGYEAGTLPGPDGACIFLRSPTPLKRQRTSQACDKCRERKAKCSGARPTCGRCAERGFICVYSTSQAPTVSGDTPSSPIKVHRKLSHSSSKEQLKASTIKNRIRRKSSQTETTVSNPLVNRPHHAFPRRHSQPASTSTYSPAPHSVAPIVSMLQEQLRIEEEQRRNDSANILISDSKGLLDYNVATQQSLNLYTQPITALNAYRFPLPSIHDTSIPLDTCHPHVNLAPTAYSVDNVLSMQPTPPVPHESMWQVSEYFPQLDLKAHESVLSIDPFELIHYNGMPSQEHISTTETNSFLGQEQQIAYHHPYSHGYKTNFES